MTCLDDDVLLALVEGLLGDREAGEVERHVDNCESCRMLLARIARVAFEDAPEEPSIADGPDRRALEPGTLVDHFQIRRPLGRGGMGEVYLARDTALGRRVALKVIRPDLLESKEVIERFLVEARTTARFNHPNVVAIHAVGQHRGAPYVALEYLDGESLAVRLARGPIPALEVVRIARAIASALAEAHRQGLLHRDLKPSNVMLPKDGRVRVVDFGLAVHLAPAEVEPRRTGARGTPLYMAPEQWSEAPITAATDLWALGIILTEAVTGRHPLEGSSIPELEARARALEPVSLPSWPDAAPRELIDLARSCTAHSPEDRPTAKEAERILGRILDGMRPPLEDESPYRGLAPFQEEHAHLFHGREEEVGALIERLRDEPVLTIVGPSGTGKSSFVQAGVIPRLRASGRWRVLRVRPGHRPFAALASHLIGERTTERRSEERRRLAEELHRDPGRLSNLLHRTADETESSLLLFVDQLEEVYTLVEDDEVRRRFLDAIGSAAEDRSDPIRVILTLRDDFLYRVTASARKKDALTHLVILRHADAPTLERILSEPLRLAGGGFEDPELLREMIRDVGGQIGSLPLLQFTAHELWELRDRRTKTLTRAAYRMLGGVAGSLAHHADAAVLALDGSGQALARELLLRLVTPEGTRQVIDKLRLLEGLDAKASHVLDQLIEARLVEVRRSASADHPELELVHESLIARWGRLARWIEESKEGLPLLDELRRAAELWDRRGRREEEVWSLEDVRRVKRATASTRLSLPDSAAQFIEASEKRAQAVLQSQRRRRIVAASLLFSTTVVSLGVAGAFRSSQRTAEQERIAALHRLADAHREGARAALHQSAFLEGRARLRAALEIRDSPEARALWARFEAEPALWDRTFEGVVYQVACSPRGDRIAAGISPSRIAILDPRNGVEIESHRTDGEPLGLAFSSAGGTLAFGTGSGDAFLLEGGVLRRIETEHKGAVFGVALDPGGERLATAGEDGTARLFDARSGERIAILSGHTRAVHDVAFDPVGRLASSSLDGTVRLWRGPGFELEATLSGHRGPVWSALFDPEGRWIATSSSDAEIRVWDPRTLSLIHTLRGHTALVSRLGLAGGFLASGSFDQTVRVFDPITGEARSVFRGHTEGIMSVCGARGAARLFSAGRDRTVRAWDLSTTFPERPLRSHTDGINAVRFSPDGARVASSSNDTTVRIWSVETGRVVSVLSGHTAAVRGIAFTPDGKRLVSSARDGVIRVWDVESGRAERILLGHKVSVFDVDVDPLGRFITSAGGNGDATVRIWDLASGAELERLSGHEGRVYTVRFDPKRERVASGSSDRTLRIWEHATGKEVAAIAQPDEVKAIAFSRDGHLLASGGSDGTVRIYDEKLVLTSTFAAPGAVHSLSFSPDGARIAIASEHQDAVIRSLAGDVLPIEGPRSGANGAEFSPDGTLLATGSDDGAVRWWSSASGRPSHRVTSTDPEARFADSHGSTRCSLGFDRRLSVRIAEEEQMLAPVALAVDAVVALRDGCLVLAEGRALVHAPRSSPRTLAEGVDALSSSGEEVYVARSDAVTVFDRSGGVRSTLRLSELDDLPSSRIVSAIVPSPELVALGFENGEVVLWRKSGARLGSTRTIGPPGRLLREGSRLAVVSELGDRSEIDLAIFETSYCELLERIWQKVPVTWEDGAVIREPPTDHACRAR